EASREASISIPAYEVREALSGEKALSDLSQALTFWPIRARTLVILLPSATADGLDEKSFERVIATLSREARSREATILVMLYGYASERLEQRLFAHQMKLQGLMSLNVRLLHWRFWRTSGLAVTNIRAKLTRQNGHWSVTQENSGDVVARDQQKVYAVDGAWRTEAQDDNVEILPTNEAVFERGRNSAAATLLFLIKDASEIQEVARAIHQLRTTRGRWLKIAVKETFTMRASVEALLLGCGANLVFQPEASYGYMRVMLNNLFGQIYSRDVQGDFDKVFEELMHTNQRGFVDRDTFISQVGAIVGQRHDSLTSRGAFVILKPKEGIEATETMMAMNVARGGDIATVAGDLVVLFLYGCQSSYLKAVLKRIYAVSPETIFDAYVDVYDNQKMQACLEWMKAYRLEEKMTQGYQAMFSYARDRSDLLNGKAEKKHFDDYVAANPVIPRPLKELGHE
ncbi:MAG: hypothetical protein J6V64_05765, partial [Burkholderiaceae bacterium]|nr:hypothetical protein [Burkholderiaceae bacterium]